MSKADPIEAASRQSGPVTTDEVMQMFRDSAKRGPWPDKQICESIACFLTGHLDNGQQGNQIHAKPSSREENLRRKAAIKTLLSPLESVRSHIELPGLFYDDQMLVALEEMERAINKASRYFLDSPTPNVAPWAAMALVIMHVTQGVLKGIGRRSAGTNDNSVAAIFTSLALKRIGVGEPTPSAVANYYRRCARRLKRA